MEEKDSRPISFFSIITTIVSILSIVFYGTALKADSSGLFSLFACFAILSLILPPISKANRLNENKKGTLFEILAIIIGGLSVFWLITILLFSRIKVSPFNGPLGETTWSIVVDLIACLGWVVCGIIYGRIKKKTPNDTDNESSNHPSNTVATIDSVQSAEIIDQGKTLSYEVEFLIYFEYDGIKYRSTYITTIKRKEDIDSYIGKKLSGFYDSEKKEFTCSEIIETNQISKNIDGTESGIISKSADHESTSSHRENLEDSQKANQPLSNLEDSPVKASKSSDANQLSIAANEHHVKPLHLQSILNDTGSTVPGRSDENPDLTLQIPQGYEVLFEEAPMQIQGGLPILIERIVLSRDISSGSLFANFAFQSLSDMPIIAMMLDISCRDIWGDSTSDVNGFQILDLVAKRGEHFSHPSAVRIPDPSTRWIDVIIKKVVFSDRTISEGTDEKFDLPKQITLQDYFESNELAEEYVRETAISARFAPVIGQSHWRCVCGEINPKSETICSKCGASLLQITSTLNREALTRNMNLRKEEARLNAEKAAEEEQRREERRIRAEEERRDREEREKIAEERRKVFYEENERLQRIEEEFRVRKEKEKKQTRKLLLIVLGSLVAVILLYAVIWQIIPYTKYSHASELYSNKEYDEAYEEYVALGNYSDSAEMALSCQYSKAVDLMNSGHYSEAAVIFEKIKDYWNSTALADYCRNMASHN